MAIIIVRSRYLKEFRDQTLAPGVDTHQQVVQHDDEQEKFCRVVLVVCLQVPEVEEVEDVCDDRGPQQDVRGGARPVGVLDGRARVLARDLNCNTTQLEVN